MGAQDPSFNIPANSPESQPFSRLRCSRRRRVVPSSSVNMRPEKPAALAASAATQLSDNRSVSVRPPVSKRHCH